MLVVFNPSVAFAQIWFFTVNEATSPGWLMLLCWLAYVAALAGCFREPSRAHLERAAVQAAEEERRRKLGGGASVSGDDLQRPLIDGSETTEDDDDERAAATGAVETLSDLAKELTRPIQVHIKLLLVLQFLFACCCSLWAFF